MRVLAFVLLAVLLSVAHAKPPQKTNPPHGDAWFVLIVVRVGDDVVFEWLKKPYDNYPECERFSFWVFDYLRGRGHPVVHSACWSADEWSTNWRPLQ